MGDSMKSEPRSGWRKRSGDVAIRRVHDDESLGRGSSRRALRDLTDGRRLVAAAPHDLEPGQPDGDSSCATKRGASIEAKRLHGMSPVGTTAGR